MVLLNWFDRSAVKRLFSDRLQGVAVLWIAAETFLSSSFRVLLLQAQRDFFGAHTYERTDKPGTFHCLWDDTHKDVGDIAGRVAGEL